MTSALPRFRAFRSFKYRPGTPSQRREGTTLATVIAALATLNLTAHFTILGSWFYTIPLGALLLLGLAKALGLSWRDLGLSPSSLKRGLVYGGVAAGVIIAAVAVGVALPLTREFFLNETYASTRTALLAALVIIPLKTVLPEELAFRGVLHGSLKRLGGMRAVFMGGSLLFGFWHVASSLHLTAGNAGLSGVLGTGTFGQWVGIGLAVIATSCAGAVFTWLRYRSQSILAPIALHWAMNAVGALAAAAAFQLG
ncbi:CAAX amino terminal protease self- immunity [Corynebacterium occultum]|uniref:CAAX amino terminal protease self-immunity n=1 Tax=Corynebacterium occultum TaxID=2675219 RepID=A0A6B8WEP7_9CORY|nr:CPBP family intramembrane glutamic endopeptidase [Corynebacterium occultum]QGU08460.1 CAAX amino terminal protease self- immunity [Corynebacterium occultum]